MTMLDGDARCVGSVAYDPADEREGRVTYSGPSSGRNASG